MAATTLADALGRLRTRSATQAPQTLAGAPGTTGTFKNSTECFVPVSSAGSGTPGAAMRAGQSCPRCPRSASRHRGQLLSKMFRAVPVVPAVPGQKRSHPPSPSITMAFQPHLVRPAGALCSGAPPPSPRRVGRGTAMVASRGLPQC